MKQANQQWIERRNAAVLDEGLGIIEKSLAEIAQASRMPNLPKFRLNVAATAVVLSGITCSTILSTFGTSGTK